MTRVTKARVRQVVLVNNEPVDPFYDPERMQLLDLEGNVLDPTKDNTKMEWTGAWESTFEYSRNQVVTHDGKMWIAPETMVAGNEPGVDTSVDYEAPVRGVQGKTYNKLEDGVPRTFTWPGDAELDTNGDLHIVLGIHFVSTLANLALHAVNESDSQLSFLVDGGSPGIGGPFNISEGPGIIEDEFINFATFYGGDLTHTLSVYVPAGTVGPFTLTLTGGDLVPPDLSSIEWEEMVITLDASEVLPAGGTDGQLLTKVGTDEGVADWEDAGAVVFPPGGADGTVLTKQSVADGDVDWEAIPPGVPSGGSTGYLLTKNSGTDYDASWVTPPHDLPVGGASGYLLAKNSGTDRDVTWVAVPHDLPVGGATGYMLVKNSSTDRDVVWAATHDIPSGGSSGQVLQKNSGTDYDTSWATAASGGGFKGEWAAGTYPAGSIVTKSGTTYGTPSSSSSVPGVPAGSNAGGSFNGIQGTTVDKIDNDVAAVTRSIALFGKTDTGGKKGIPLIFDFTSGTLANISVTVVNNTNEVLSFVINGSGGASDSVFSVSVGSTVTRSIRFASFWGGSNPGQVFLQGTTGAPTGSVDVTATGANLNPPDPINPWVVI